MAVPAFRGRVRPVLAVLSALLVGGGVAGLGWSLSDPDGAALLYGQVHQSVDDVISAVDGTSPTVYLDVDGGAAALKTCDDRFSEVAPAVGERPGVWAAHNLCGGDVVLGLELGDTVLVDAAGVVESFVVNDSILGSKTATYVDDLAELRGELILQSCYYGGTDVPMRFVSLSKV